MSGSVDLKGVHVSITALDLEWARLLEHQEPRLQRNDQVLRLEMR